MKLISHHRLFVPVLLTVLCFLIYGNTLSHDYALDDVYAITMNRYVAGGLSGIPDIIFTDYFSGFSANSGMNLPGGRYRPLLLISFALENELFGLNPHFSHFINVLLYSLLLISIYFALQHVLNDKKTALIACLFFLAHPVHVEAVANIKARDELFCLLFGILSFRFAFKEKWLLSAVFFFLSVCSKETGVLFVFIVPFALYLFSDRRKINQFFPLWTMMVALTGYLFLRSHAVTPSGIEEISILNNPFVNVSTGERLATVMMIMLRYIKLLLVPFPLTFDYSPFYLNTMQFSDSVVILSVFVHLLIAVLVYIFRKDAIVVFSILLYFITLLPVSNLFVNIGTYMNERFLFVPSLGFVILLSLLIVNKQYPESLRIITVLIIFFVFSFLTIYRNRSWKDNFTLFSNDIRVSANSVVCNSHLANEYIFKANHASDSILQKTYYSLAEKYFTRAIQLYPQHSIALRSLADLRLKVNRDTAGSLDLFLSLVRMYPNGNFVRDYLSIIGSSRNLTLKEQYLLKLLSIIPRSFEANYATGIFYGSEMHWVDRSIRYFNVAINLRPITAAFVARGTGYYMKNDYDSALMDFRKAALLDTMNPQYAYNVGMVFHKMKQDDSAVLWYNHFRRRGGAKRGQ